MSKSLDSDPRNGQERALLSYVAAIRGHRRVVVLVLLATILASLAFLLLRSPTYEATSELLVEPLPQEDQLFLGLPLLRDTGDPVRTVETAASLLESEEAADLAAEQLDGSETGQQLLEDVVTIEPSGGSNLLAITATGDTAEEAAETANEFAGAALEVRADDFRAQARDLIDQLQARLDETPRTEAETRSTLATRIEQLRSALGAGDPTLVLARPAVPPTASEGASPALVLLLAAIVGGILGIGTAIALELLTRNIRDEEELTSLFPMPVLARVPRISAKSLRAPVRSSWYMPPEIAEPFRTLTVQLERDAFPSCLMVTSPSKGDGKTSSTLNLGVALAAAGRSVIVLDFDLRNPQVADVLRLGEGLRLEQLFEPDLDLGKLLVKPSPAWPLYVLPIRLGGQRNGLSDPASWGLAELIGHARRMADYVLVDTPPLGEVSDALHLVGAVDSILVVARPGNTSRSQLRHMRELLERIGKRPAGYILIDDFERPSGGYYGFGIGGVAPDLLMAPEGTEPVANRSSR